MVRGSANAFTVTLVEHDEGEAAGVLTALGQWDIPCQSGRSLEEGLNLLRSRPTPIVISDLHAPGPSGNGRLGGLKLAAEVKQHWPETAVMLLAGDDDSAEA